MADYGLSTLGIRVYAAESPDGTKITTASAYRELTRVNSVGEITVEANNIDVSSLIDRVTRYVQGRSDVSDTLAITINLTNDTYAEWAVLAGKKICVLIDIPRLDNQVFIIVTVPAKIPLPALEQNTLLTVAINCTTNNFIGYDEKVEGVRGADTITLNKTTASVVEGGTVVLIAKTDPELEDVVWTSSSDSIATVSNGVVTGVSDGTATITATSGSATATASITVTAV